MNPILKALLKLEILKFEISNLTWFQVQTLRNLIRVPQPLLPNCLFIDTVFTDMTHQQVNIILIKSTASIKHKQIFLNQLNYTVLKIKKL